MANSDNIVMNGKKIERALTRIAHEILERNSGAESLALIGVITRGASMAQRIAERIKKIEKIEVPVGLMDIGLYRDDIHTNLDQPLIQTTEIPFQIRDKNIILVDDVLFTGRTIRAALDQIIDFGRPRSIQLAVLIDRGHRELPFRADYVGMNLPTAKSDKVIVQLAEKDGIDQVFVTTDTGRKNSATKQTTKKEKKKKESAKGGSQ